MDESWNGQIDWGFINCASCLLFLRALMKYHVPRKNAFPMDSVDGFELVEATRDLQLKGNESTKKLFIWRANVYPTLCMTAAAIFNEFFYLKLKQFHYADDDTFHSNYFGGYGYPVDDPKFIASVMSSLINLIINTCTSPRRHLWIIKLNVFFFLLLSFGRHTLRIIEPVYWFGDWRDFDARGPPQFPV